MIQKPRGYFHSHSFARDDANRRIALHERRIVRSYGDYDRDARALASAELKQAQADLKAAETAIRKAEDKKRKEALAKARMEAAE